MPVELPQNPQIPTNVSRRLEQVYREFASQTLPASFEEFIRDEWGIDLSAKYAGMTIRSPFGKASGQLSMTSRQVRDDVDAGLGFVVLKTVIAQNQTGQQSMQAWSSPDTRMVVERIPGKQGEPGWTTSWKGRGWHKSFGDYLQLIQEANEIAADSGCLIIPSCKYHLPATINEAWNIDEYKYTTRHLHAAWQRSYNGPANPTPLEKDFSPTLAGDSLSEVREPILHWLNQVPGLILNSLEPDSAGIRIGMKLFNTLFDDDFQVELLSAIHSSNESPDFYVYGNRLFDPQREFEGTRGIAYGGPDLSDRNLRVLTQFRNSSLGSNLLPHSATGNINSGRRAVEYMLCGAENFQIHTYFQLPATEFSCRVGNKTYKALHELYFHPQTGLVAWLFHLASELNLLANEFSFRDIVREIRERHLTLRI
ncbi:dihydropyrimidine dehydrogenase subunit B [Polystyrenella longa]|uniref:Dihydropyrimidine dehydrogenase subunit B n=1 Tax=Polystyrenella longa TaxID=2528007 RepID=A0A518CLU2_9PLAN|nr:hypothetical protein [Polystyrenella longa]QDU80188.1 dihydropyrimidine dehydrogenase subunit B [Polystyrenella longa]